MIQVHFFLNQQFMLFLCMVNKNLICSVKVHESTEKYLRVDFIIFLSKTKDLHFLFVEIKNFKMLWEKTHTSVIFQDFFHTFGLWRNIYICICIQDVPGLLGHFYGQVWDTIRNQLRITTLCHKRLQSSGDPISRKTVYK